MTCRWKFGLLTVVFLFSIALPVMAQNSAAPSSEAYLTWTAAQATAIGKSFRSNGRAGHAMDWRVIHTENAYKYELRATLMTPETIRAAARLEQLHLRLTDNQTRALVAEADTGKSLVILVEINPREGSGVVPLDWTATLSPSGVGRDSNLVIGGIKRPDLRRVKALAGVVRRDYAFDLFWVEFPLTNADGEPIWETVPPSLDLMVGIHEKQGRVRWPVTDSLRQYLNQLAGK
jgi:hypothetical protein